MSRRCHSFVAECSYSASERRQLRARRGRHQYCHRRRGSFFFRQKAARFASQGIPDVFRDQSVKDFFYDLANFPETGTDSLLELHAIRLHGVTGVPETYLVGRDGIILDKHTGPLQADDVRSLAERAR